MSHVRQYVPSFGGISSSVASIAASVPIAPDMLWALQPVVSSHWLSVDIKDVTLTATYSPFTFLSCRTTAKAVCAHNSGTSRSTSILTDVAPSGTTKLL